MMSDDLTPQEVERFWEYNYELLYKQFELYKVRHKKLEENYNELLKRVYADDDRGQAPGN